MALGKKQVVIYGAVAVVVLGALVMGGLAWTGQIKIKAGADVPVRVEVGEGDLSRWLTPGRWNLVTVPCNSDGGKITNTDILASNIRREGVNGYMVQYDTGSEYIEGGNIKLDTKNNLGNRARGYWIKANATRGNQIYTTCQLPTTDVTILLKVGGSVPVGNPFSDYLHVSGIKLVVDGTEIPLTTALNNKQIQLAFYRAGHWTDSPSTDTSAYTMVDSRDALVTDALGGASELAPFAGFYAAVAQSLGNSVVSLKFTHGAASTNCADPCATTTCKAWGEKSDIMEDAHAAYCAARPTP